MHKLIADIKKYLEKNELVKNLLFFILLSLPILILCLPYISRPHTIMLFDWDYFSQMYEASRISILKFHQFPLFNPWVAGGVPLYANPQFGLFSIQSLLTLIFGTVYGLKLSICSYFFFGFWGTYLLLRYNRSEKLRAALLGYIFISGGYGIYHITGGHLTFAEFFLAPLTILGFQRLIKEGKWLAFTLIMALSIQSFTHYSVMQLMILLVVLVVLTILFLPYDISRKKTTLLFLNSLALLLILSLPRLYLAVQYLKSYPRIGNDHFMVSLKTIILSFIIPPSAGYHIMPRGLHYSWGEYSAYCGILFLIALGVILLIAYSNKKLISKEVVAITAIAVVSLSLALGDFSKISPFHILLKLPGYSSMIAPARWLGWVFLSMIIIVGIIKLNKNQNRIVCIILFLSIVEISTFNFSYLKFMNPNIPIINTDGNNSFEQYDDLSAKSTMRYFDETRKNVGEIRGYEAILSYDLFRPTDRCGINNGCGIIISNNANLIYWSPNKINLLRTGAGDIEVNINPGSYWLVNNKRVFRDMRVVELTRRFIISDQSEKIELLISPTF